MEPNELKPQEPQQVNQTAPPEVQPPVNEPKKFPKKLVLIIAVVMAVMLAGGLALFKTVLNQSNPTVNTNNTSAAKNLSSTEPKAVEQVLINPANNSKINIKETEYYTVKAADTEYYGRVSKINNDYIRLLPTAYKKGSVLTFTGKELHGPEAATYFKVSKVTKFEAVTDTAIIGALKAADSTVSDAFPSNDISKYVKNGQFQAYFFTDGTAFFAKTTNLDGTFLASSSHVYVLRTNSTSPGGATDISLALAKPEHYNKLTAENLLYWQNMKSDSQITKAAAQYEKQNP